METKNKLLKKPSWRSVPEGSTKRGKQKERTTERGETEDGKTGNICRNYDRTSIVKGQYKVSD